jgi:uncharacterized protein
MHWDAAYDPDPRHDRAVDAAAEPGERTYATFIHLSLLLWHVLIPIVPALILWLIKRSESPFLDDHGREAVNFQISLLLYGLLCIPIGIITCGVGFVLVLAVYVLAVVGMILAAMAAHRGQYYRYPMTLRLV